MKFQSPLSTLSLSVLLAVIGGALAGMTASIYTQESLKDYLQTLTTRPDVSLISQVKPASLPGTYEEALSKVGEVASPSIAILRAKTADSVNPMAWQVATGTDRPGVVVTSDGWILFMQPTASSFLPTATNSEVWIGGERFAITKIVSDSLTSLSMVKVEGQNFSAVPFGKSSEARAGEIVFGLLDDQRLLATSLVDISTSLTSDYRAEEYGYYWMIDSSVGSSSAPLVNASGELIGFADTSVTPLDHILPFVQSVLKDGYASYAGLGATIVDINQVINIDSALKMNQKEGALVISLPNGPAKTAGVKAFDLITAIDGVPVTSSNTIAIQLKRYVPGSKIKLTVVRSAISSEIEVTLGDYADLIY